MARVIVIISVVLMMLTLTGEENNAKVEKKEESKIPEWISKIELKGDFRLRYQYQNATKENDEDGKIDTLDRSRMRYRMRFGIGATVNDWVKVNFGLASGSASTTISPSQITSGKKISIPIGNDPRSTNQTFEGFFSRKPIWIDYAYGEVTPYKGISLIGGKMKNPIFTTEQLVWDSDITPEGGALALNFELPASTSLFFNGGAFVLDEVKAPKNDDGSLDKSWNDPVMVFVQLGTGIKNNLTDTKIAFAYYHPVRLQYEVFNASTPEGQTVADYVTNHVNYRAFNIELASSWFFGKKYTAGVFGEFTMNTSPLESKYLGSIADEKFAYLAGIKGGTKDLKNLGDFQISALYREFQAVAWFPVFTDADFLDGAPNISAIKASATAAIFKNTFLTATYIYSFTANEDISGTEESDSPEKVKEHLVQVDISAKF
ncbi:MAG TPA: putative porin [bacterium]|nr:putative porin [bacterium]HPS29609.1 putative porin [bacterium]